MTEKIKVRKGESPQREVKSTVRDDTKRQRVAQDLNESEERYRSTLDGMLEGVQLISRDWRYLYVNEAAAKQGRRAKDELLGRTMMEVYPGIEQTEMFAELRRCLETRVPHQMENEFTFPDGGKGWFELSIQPAPEGALILSVDISERKRAEQALRLSEEKFNKAFRISPEAMNIAELESGRILDANDNYTRLIGYSLDEIIGRTVFELGIYKNPEERANRVKILKEKGRFSNEEFTLLPKAGEERTCLASAELFKFEQGDYILGALKDVTEQKKAEEALRHSEEMLRLLFESVSLGIAVTDLNGAITEANPHMVKTLGFQSRSELIGRNIYEFNMQRSHASALQMRQTLEKGIKGTEYSLRKADGTMFPGEFTASVLKDAAGNLSGFITIIRDITERKKAEEEIRKFKTITDQAGYGATVTSIEGIFSYVNEAFAQMHGYPPAELVGQHYSILYTEEQLKVVKQIRESSIKEGSYFAQEIWRKKKDGSVFPTYTTNVIIKDNTGKPLYLAAMAMDITERKKAAEALIASETAYRRLFEAAKDGILIVNAETGLIIDVNPFLTDLLGFSKEDLLGKELWEIGAFKNIVSNKAKFEELHQKGYIRYEDLPLRTAAGRQADVEFVSNVYKVDHRKVIQCNIRDITERKQAQERLQQAAQEWRRTFDSITDPISIHDRDFRITRVNMAFAQTFNLKPKEIIGRHCYELVHGTTQPPLECPHQVTLETNKSAKAETYEPKIEKYLDISTSPIIDDKGQVIASVHVMRDVTERKNMEQQLVLTDRLASLGELASGIAHEVNNPLTGVIGISQLLLARDLPADVKEDLQLVHNEAQRAAQVVKNLLAFARKHPVAKQPTNVNEVIAQVLGIRAYEQKVNNIHAVTHLAADLPEVMADPFQLQQVFFNLVINAEYFMLEAHKKGTLVVTTEKSGENITISFADDGPGIPADSLKRLFAPFFTTKPVGKGTGLGLSICHGVVTAHGGRIHAESEPGKSTTFIVELPLRAEKGDETQ